MSQAVAAFAQQFPLIYQLFTTRLKWSLGFIAALFLILAVSLYAQLLHTADGLFTSAGPIIGGDFIVFDHAARVAGTPDMLSIYEMKNLQAQLQAAHPGQGDFAFAWMYPPTMSLVLAPFAWPDYLTSFTLWVAIFASAFLLLIRRLWANRWALFFVASCPAVFFAVVTGQNGLLTATLIAAAGAFADKRPILAGVAAALLTVKPQLGLLIPIAFIAGGCWRAFAAAAVGSLAFSALSIAAFGVDAWTAFFNALTTHGGRMAETGFPFSKLATPFGFATMIGLPAAAASAVQIAASLALAAYVAIVWRRVKEWDLRVAALSTAAILATPYAFYYEIVIMAPALMLIARRGVETGWLRYEKLTLIAAWVVPLMMPGDDAIPGPPVCSVGAIFAFLIVARRAWPAATLMSASAMRPAAAG